VIIPLLMLSNRFRWVYCQLEVLRNCLPKNLRRVLKELPKSLDETYQRILKEINNANQKEAHQLLQCLAVAYRPLRVEELAEVLALDVDAAGIPRFNANWRWEDHEAAVLSACSSLVSVIYYAGSRVFQFSHFSVKEFLTSDRLASLEDVSQFHISNEPSHAILAQACLGVLLSVDDHTSDDNIEDIALLPYADDYWGEHVRIGKVELHIKDALDSLFDVHKTHFEASFRRIGMDHLLRPFRDEDSKGVLTPAALLIFAGVIGFSGLAERLIVANQPQAIGSRFQGWTQLHLVVRFEGIEVARLLLAHGADINSRPDYATSPHIASLQSHIERPVDGMTEEIDEIENSLHDSNADVSIDDIMGCGKESGFTPLHIAALKGHFNMCQMLLEHKADLRARDSRGNTPLHLATYEYHLEIARILLEYNVEVDSRNEDGSTPLFIASSNRNVDISRYRDIMRLLLDHGANVNAHDNRRNTPLHVAASEGDLEVARMLLEHKADANALGNEGSTPLHKASQGSRSRGEGQEMVQLSRLVRLFLDNGADPHAHDDNGSTPLHFAVSKGHLEVTRMLLERKADVNSLNGEGLTPLQRASEGPRKGYPDIMQLLLDHGANVNVHDNRRNTPLHFAASEGHLEIARMLLEHKADVNALGIEGSTPLHKASQGSQSCGGGLEMVQLVRLFLDNGADPHVRDDNGSTPLHFAVSKGHLEVTRMLLELKADVNSFNGEGLTPLQRALEGPREGYPDFMRLLLDHGANVNVHDNRRSTLLHFAASEGHLEVARMLLERKANVNALDDEGSTPLHQASHSSQSGDADITQLVRLLLDNGADPHACDNNGNTPLHFAASEGHLEVVRTLLERKADVDSLNGEGLAPLQRASEGRREGYLDIMRLLLDHGANVNVHDNSRNTPLHFAASRSHLEVARMLLELKADVNALNKEGSTPLHQAFETWRKNPDIVRLLLDHGADANVHDKRGNTLLHFAASEGDLKITRVLLERIVEVVNSQNDDGYTAFLLALKRQNLDVARLLLDHNPDVHVRDERGYTPLHVAVRNGHLDICRILLERNADVNSQTHHRSTPLLIASEVGTPDLVQLFLDHNADVHVCDADGDTPLHCATIGGKLEVARLLLKLDIEVNSRNNKGLTPLHLASAGYRVRNPDIVRLLLDHGADAQAQSHGGETASKVARAPNWQEIVQLLTQNVAE
jgi:ankyrin repeat protein